MPIKRGGKEHVLITKGFDGPNLFFMNLNGVLKLECGVEERDVSVSMGDNNLVSLSEEGCTLLAM